MINDSSLLISRNLIYCKYSLGLGLHDDIALQCVHARWASGCWAGLGCSHDSVHYNTLEPLPGHRCNVALSWGLQYLEESPPPTTKPNPDITNMPSTLFRRCRTPAEERHSPPAWNPAPEKSHALGLFNEATDDDWERAEAFCRTHPPTPPKLLASDVIDRIRVLGCTAWSLERPIDARFMGHVERGDRINTWTAPTEKRCRDSCVMSDLPLMAGLYDIHGRRGIYYEVRVNRMDGVLAIGTLPESYFFESYFSYTSQIPSAFSDRSQFLIN